MAGASDRVSQALARFRRLEAAIGRLTGPGTAVDRAISAVAGQRERAVRAAGAWLTSRLPEPVLAALSRARALVRRAFEFAANEPTGAIGAVLVWFVGLFLVRLLWTPLSLPASIVNTFISPFTPVHCNFVGPSNVVSDLACGTVIAVLTTIGALIAMVALLLFRLPLRRITAAIVGSITGPGSFMVTPIVAAVLFTVGWAGVQFHFPSRPGLVQDGDFPALVGLATYALARYGPLARRYASGAFAAATALTPAIKLGVTLAVPFVVSLVTTPVLHTPERDQIAVLAAMVTGYLLFAPPVRQPEEAEA